MLEMRERILLVSLALLVIFVVAGRMRELDRRVVELEEWRSR